MIIKEAGPFKAEVISLLNSAKLPIADLTDQLDDFIVANGGDQITGVAGLETYGNCGLLRSLVVAKAHRGKGIASLLVTEIESMAAKKGLKAIYLLTETASDYFNKKGYEHVARMDIPEDMKMSSQFSFICPESAIAMIKTLTI